MMDSAAGETSAPPSPCSPRGRMSHVSAGRERAEEAGDGEEDEARDEDALAAEQVGARPPSSRKPPNEQRVGVDHPLEVAWENPRSAWIDGSATFTIVASRIDHELREADETSTSHGLTRPAVIQPTVAACVAATGYGFPYR